MKGRKTRYNIIGKVRITDTRTVIQSARWIPNEEGGVTSDSTIM
jgi:hypothetical protein